MSDLKAVHGGWLKRKGDAEPRRVEERETESRYQDELAREHEEAPDSTDE